MTITTTDGRTHSGAGPLRVLVAVHGYEPDGWAHETARVLSTWTWSLIRVLAVLDVPSPPFTSLHGRARRMYEAARGAWARHEDARLQVSIDALRSAFTRDIDVVRACAIRSDFARTVAAHADDWPSDVVVVGAPDPVRRWRLRPGPVHTHVVRRLGCTVVVTGRPAETTARPRMVAMPPTVAERRA